MKLTDFVPENHIILDLRASSKKGVFEALASAVASETDIDAKHVLDLLLERERLGTTGIGEGVAIPHAKIKDLPELVGFFIRTSSPIDFDALDEKDVDLVFVLLAPEGASAEHLKALAKIARVFRDTDRRDELRKAKSPEEVITLLNEHPARNAA